MDVVAGLRPCAVEVQLGEWLYLIPERPAADWIEAIVDPEGGAVVPGLMDDVTRQDVWTCFLRGQIEREELEEAWKHALEAATGQRWWSAARVFLSATEQSAWTVVHGELLIRGIDLTRVSIGAAYNAIYRIALENCKDQAERAKLEFDIAQAPPGVDLAESYDKKEAAANFLSALGVLRGMDEGRTPG